MSDKKVTKIDLEEFRREIENTPNRFTRMFGWYLYWSAVLELSNSKIGARRG